MSGASSPDSLRHSPMATTTSPSTSLHLSLFPLISPTLPSLHPLLHFPTSKPITLRRPRSILRAMGSDVLGDFGGRDPFPEEIESNFGEKVLGFMSTEHKILIPNASALSLAQQKCGVVDQRMSPLGIDEAKALLLKVVGWRLLEEKEGLKLQCLWKLRDFKCGIELINRVAKVAEEAGHYPSLHLEEPYHVRAELWTPLIGGLSINDFIVAAKIDEIKTSDLVPRKRVWA